MRLNVSATLDYGIEAPADLLVQIEAAAMPDQSVIGAKFDPGQTAHLHRIAAEDGVGTRVWLHCDQRLICSYNAEIRIDRSDPDLSTLSQDPVHQLPHEAVRYLMASRFCPSDEFQSFTDSQFGHLSGGAFVDAVARWIETRFTYAPGASQATTTAIDTFVSRRGICRDYAHVMISLARAAAIPARMVSCYAPRVTPQDFHAVVQVWLDGDWRIVDPTGMASASETAIIGVGRDAADIAFLTSYGWVTLKDQRITVSQA
ncbi:transglutaminase family protein [Maribius pontilimi]|uniref:Transglutaminase family protein n=1 Tax=Palleronia pontilimi TaxID=1964209 RepID=A0A934IEB1_9RHOB|nr:transglutaminase family protein [Palleronia pontilimi]MBJ3761890.1 transglutaminase family protein [Palleronia pontilimi]